MDYSRLPLAAPPDDRGLRSGFYRTPQEEQQAILNNQERQHADQSSWSRGLRRGGHQTAGMLFDAAGQVFEPIPSASGLSQSLFGMGRRQHDLMGSIPLAVETSDDVRGIGDLGSFIAGQAGQMLPQQALRVPAAAAAMMMAPVGAGALTLGALGAAGGMLGGAAPMALGEQARNLQEDEYVMANTTPGQRLKNAATYAALAAPLDVAGDVLFAGRLLGATKALKKGVKPALKHVAKAVPEAAVTEGLPEAGQERISQILHSQLNPTRDTSEDVGDMRRAFFAGWAGGVGMTGAGRGVTVARENAPEIRQAISDTVGSARKRVADFLKPADLPPEMANASDAEILAWDDEQRQARSTAAEELAKDAVADENTPSTLRQKAEEFLRRHAAGAKDAWQDFAQALDTERMAQTMVDGIERFTANVKPRKNQELTPDDAAIFADFARLLPKDIAERHDPGAIYSQLRDALIEASVDLPWNELTPVFGGEDAAVSTLTRMRRKLEAAGMAEADPTFETNIRTAIKHGVRSDNRLVELVTNALLPRHPDHFRTPEVALATARDLQHAVKNLYGGWSESQRAAFDAHVEGLFGHNSNNLLQALIQGTERQSDMVVDPDMMTETEDLTSEFVGPGLSTADPQAQGSKRHGGFFRIDGEHGARYSELLAAAKAKHGGPESVVRTLNPAEYARIAGIDPEIVASELGVSVDELATHPARILHVAKRADRDAENITADEITELGKKNTERVLNPRTKVDRTGGNKVATEVQRALKLEAGARFKALRELGLPNAVRVERTSAGNFVVSNMNHGGAGRITVTMKDGSKQVLSAMDIVARSRSMRSPVDAKGDTSGPANLMKHFMSGLSAILNNEAVGGVEVNDFFSGKPVFTQEGPPRKGQGRGAKYKQKTDDGAHAERAAELERQISGALGPYFQLAGSKRGDVSLQQGRRDQSRRAPQLSPAAQALVDENLEAAAALDKQADELDKRARETQPRGRFSVSVEKAINDLDKLIASQGKEISALPSVAEIKIAESGHLRGAVIKAGGVKAAKLKRNQLVATRKELVSARDDLLANGDMHALSAALAKQADKIKALADARRAAAEEIQSRVVRVDEGTIDSLDGEIEALHAQFEALHTQLDDAYARMMKAKTDKTHEKYEARAEELEQQIKDLEQQIEALETKRDALADDGYIRALMGEDEAADEAGVASTQEISATQERESAARPKARTHQEETGEKLGQGPKGDRTNKAPGPFPDIEAAGLKMTLPRGLSVKHFTKTMRGALKAVAQAARLVPASFRPTLQRVVDRVVKAADENRKLTTDPKYAAKIKALKTALDEESTAAERAAANPVGTQLDRARDLLVDALNAALGRETDAVKRRGLTKMVAALGGEPATFEGTSRGDVVNRMAARLSSEFGFQVRKKNDQERSAMRAAFDAVASAVPAVDVNGFVDWFGVMQSDGKPAGRTAIRDGFVSVLINEDVFIRGYPALNETAQERVNRVMAHEVAHAMDAKADFSGNWAFHITGETNFDKGGEFQPGGVFYNEAMGVLNSDPYLATMLGYIQDHKNAGKELFAQLFAIHTTRPEVMRAKFPKAYQDFRKVFGGYAADQSQRHDDGGRKVGAMPPGRQSSTKANSQAVRIHKELGKEGIPATHDSPIRHEGEFDWRKNIGKGEGHAAFGVGTYLSTGDGVHRNYKNQFTAITRAEAFETEWINNSLRDTLLEIDKLAENGQVWFNTTLMSAQSRAYVQRIGLSTYKPMSVDKAKRLINERIKENSKEFAEGKSPTYEVTVNIKPEQLLDWNAPLSKQPTALAAIKKAILSGDLKPKGHIITGDTLATSVRTPVRKVFKDVASNPESVTGEMIYKALAEALGTHDIELTGWTVRERLAAEAKASEYLQSLGILGHKYNSGGVLQKIKSILRKDTPNYVIYDDSKIETNYVHFNREDSAPSAAAMDPQVQQSIIDYVEKVLGPKVAVAFREVFKDGGGSGRWSRSKGKAYIGIAMRAMNPMSVAHHEAMHEFFQRLSDDHPQSAAILERAASSPAVIRQIERFFANEPNKAKIMADIKADPHERVAYMFQLWAAGRMKVGPKTDGVFEKVKAFLRKAFGLMTEGEQAETIMAAFHQGRMSEPSAVAKVLSRELKDNSLAVKAALATARPTYDKLRDLVVTAQNTLTDSANPVLKALGYDFSIPTGVASKKMSFMGGRVQMSNRYLNKLMKAIELGDADDLAAAVDGLQRGEISKDEKVAAVQKNIRALLDDLYDYLTTSGVDVGKRKDYFTRVWDSMLIAENRAEFIEMLKAEHQRTQGKPLAQKAADAIVDVLITNRGAEALTENDYHVGFTPFMASANKRTLSWVNDPAFAKFQRKDGVEILSGYISHAVHRAEYAKRFDNNGEGIRSRLFAAAEYEFAKIDPNLAAWKKAEKEAIATEEALAKKEDRKPQPVDLGDVLARLPKEIRQKSKDAERILREARQAIMAMEGTLGSTNPETMGKNFMRKVTPALTVYQHFRLLSLTLFTQLTDPHGVMVRGGKLNDAMDTFVEGWKGAIAGWKGKPIEDSAWELARELGMIDASMSLNTMGNMYSAVYLDGRIKKMNDSFFRWNGVEMFSQGTRVGALKAAQKFLEFHGKVGNEHSERYLTELGLTKADLANGVDTNNPAIQDALFRWVDQAIIRPNAALRPSWASDPHYALFFHMKQFTYAFHKVILERMALEAKHGNYSPIMVGLSAYIPTIIAADTIRAIISHGGELPRWRRRMSLEDQVWNGVQRSGLTGIPQFGLDVLEWGPAGLFGPAPEQLYKATIGRPQNAWRDALPNIGMVRGALS